MSFISPALIARIYQALGRNKGCHAILLLRQHAFDKQPQHDGELMALVVKMADQCLVDADLSRAEDHYKLGLALHESVFQDSSLEALRCVSGLLTIYEQQERDGECSEYADLLQELSAAISSRYATAKVKAV